MSLTIQSLFYATYTVLAVGLVVVAIAMAWGNSREIGVRHTLIAMVGGTALLAVHFAYGWAREPGYGWLLPLAWLLPVLCVGAATWNLRSARGWSTGSKAMCLATCAWNALLAAIYSLRAAHELFHVDFGSAGAGLLSAFTLVQCNVGSTGAERLPVYLYLPILLAPGRAAGGLTLLTRGLGAFLATFMTSLTIAALPAGSETARHSEPTRGKPVERRPGLRLSITAGDAELSARAAPPAVLAVVGNTPDWSQIVSNAKDLGLDALDIPVAADTVRHPECVARLSAMVGTAREAGLGVTLVVYPPTNAHRLSMPRFQEIMEEAQWFLSENVDPDLLVLYPRPTGRWARTVVGEQPASKWLQVVEDSARRLRQGKPRQRIGIEIEPATAAAREMFEKLSRSDSKLDEIRFVVDGSRSGGPGLTRTLIELGGWLASNPTRLRLTLATASPTPLSQGSSTAQIAQVERLAAFAASQPLIGGLSLGQMLDDAEGLAGFWDNRGRPRPVVPFAYEIVRQLRGGPKLPPGPGR